MGTPNSSARLLALSHDDVGAGRDFYARVVGQVPQVLRTDRPATDQANFHGANSDGCHVSSPGDLVLPARPQHSPPGYLKRLWNIEVVHLVPQGGKEYPSLSPHPLPHHRHDGSRDPGALEGGNAAYLLVALEGGRGQDLGCPDQRACSTAQSSSRSRPAPTLSDRHGR